MGSKRDREEQTNGEIKRQKVEEEKESDSPKMHAFENPLLPLASYDDDDEEEERRREAIRRRGVEENAKKAELNGRVNEVYDDDEEEDEDDANFNQGKRNRSVEVRRDCPYLDTVNRQVLDFDFEKFCSISLTNLNVYACLVCGKYFQGRGPKSHAYTHSLEAGHHVYINLKTEKVYCLPDGYEINDPSLDDIRHVLNPRFNREQVQQLDKSKLWARALDGSDYFLDWLGLIT